MDTYSGPVRILDSKGILLTVGSADLERVPERDSWQGLLRMIANTGVAGKALHVKIEIPGGPVSDAALDPQQSENGIAFSRIAGIGPAPF